MEGLVAPVDKDECSGCHRRAAEDEEFKCCSRCKQAYYCSKDCQVNNWKIHKANCKRHAVAKAQASQEGKTRELRLLQEWKRQVKNGGILAYMLLNFFGWNVLSRLEQEDYFIMLHLVFDYNKRNFVPESEPAIASIAEAGQHAHELRQGYASTPPVNANQCKILVAITVEGMRIGSVMPFLIEKPTEAMSKGAWSQQRELLNDVTLYSSKFAMWPDLLQQNLRTSINSSVRTNAHFQPFLTNALHIVSANSLHKTNVVMIEMSMGHGLGEIKCLESYSVKPVAEVSSLLEQAGLLTAETRQLLDLEHNPQLVQSRKQYPHNCLLPVFFYCNRTRVGIIVPNLIEILPNHPVYSVKKCNQNAKAAFQKLQKIHFPSVKSPELH